MSKLDSMPLASSPPKGSSLDEPKINSGPPPIRNPAIATEKPAITLASIHRPIVGTVRPTLRSNERKPFSWRLVSAILCYAGWTVFIKTTLAIIYFALISQGFRHVLEDTGMRLSKLPGLDWLDDFEATYRLDVANGCAVVLLVVSWIAWSLLLRWNISMDLQKFFLRFGCNLDIIRTIIFTFSTIIIVGDGGLFYASFVAISAFGSSAFSPTAAVATVVYVSTLMFINFISFYLFQCIKDVQAGQASL